MELRFGRLKDFISRVSICYRVADCDTPDGSVHGFYYDVPRVTWVPRKAEFVVQSLRMRTSTYGTPLHANRVLRRVRETRKTREARTASYMTMVNACNEGSELFRLRHVTMAVRPSRRYQ
jgi:hypothetical protein